MSLIVKIVLDKGKLKAKIEDQRSGKKKFFFYLMRDGSVIDRVGWKSSDTYEWKADAPGLYSVRGFSELGSEKIDAFSDKVRIMSGSVANDWEHILASGEVIEDLPFVSYVEPHQDFIVSNITSWRKLSFSGFATLSSHRLPSGLSIFFNGAVGRNARTIFSGTAFVGDQLIFGQSEAELKKHDDLLHQPGDFSSVFLRPDSMIVSTDYFGVQKVFYYANGQSIVASNRLHLLALALRASGLDLAMDSRIVTATLAGGYTQVYQQAFSSKTAFAGITLLPIDKEIEIFSGGYRLKDKPIRDALLADNFNLSEKGSLEGIEDGATEILQHAKAVISHPKFERVLVDATGGMDSRAIVSAASNFKNDMDRMYVNACETASIPLDIRVACTMAQFLGFQFDDLSEDVEFTSRKRKQQSALSYLFGSYFAHNMEGIRGENRFRDSVINITGFFGEICLRPYYSRSHVKKPELQALDTDSFINFLRGENHVVIGGDEEKNILFDELKEALEAVPGRNSLEKYDLHYLYYRNGLHCSDTFRWGYETPRVGIIQSPTLFRLKRKLYGKHSNTYLQNEVIARLNSEILSLPYASPNDNAELAEALPQIRSMPETFKNRKIDVMQSGELAIAARSEKKISTRGDASQSNRGLDMDTTSKSAVVALSEKAGLVSKEFGQEILSDIQNGSALRHVLINKVTMMHWMWRITQMTPDEAKSLIH